MANSKHYTAKLHAATLEGLMKETGSTSFAALARLLIDEHRGAGKPVVCARCEELTEERDEWEREAKRWRALVESD